MFNLLLFFLPLSTIVKFRELIKFEQFFFKHLSFEYEIVPLTQLHRILIESLNNVYIIIVAEFFDIMTEFFLSTERDYMYSSTVLSSH